MHSACHHNTRPFALAFNVQFVGLCMIYHRRQILMKETKQFALLHLVLLEF